jgi:hypothetical protein
VRRRRSYYLFLTFQVVEEVVVEEKYEFGAGKLGIDFTMSIVYT